MRVGVITPHDNNTSQFYQTKTTMLMFHWK